MQSRRNVARLGVPVLLAILLPAVAGAGTVIGKAVLVGAYSVADQASMDADQLIRAQRSLVVSDKNGLANVMVSVEGVPGTFEPSETLPVLDQSEKTFVPHVLPIVRGQKVQFVNSDRILHNIHAYKGKDTAFNLAMPLHNQHMTKKIVADDVMMVTCDVHRHMRAWILVRDNPYFAVSKESGLFSIEGVPEGTYTIRAWHELLGSLEQTVTIEGGDAKTPVLFKFRGQ